MTQPVQAAPLPVEAMTSRQLVRRAKLIEAVIDLVREVGPGAVQMRDVADRSGIALGTVYRYFSSKEHLLATALADWQERLTRRVLMPRAGEEKEFSGDLTERVLSFVRKEIRGFARNPKIAELMVQVHVSSDPYARDALARMGAVNDQVMDKLLAGVAPERAEPIKNALGSVLMNSLTYWVTGRITLAELTSQVESVTRLVLEHAAASPRRVLQCLERGRGSGAGRVYGGHMDVDLCGRRIPFEALESSSFVGFLSSYAPRLLPGGSWRGLPDAGDLMAAEGIAQVRGTLPHATTIVAVVCDEGVVLASDRRATTGSMISKRDVEKVFRCDEFSAVGIAGVLGLGLEVAKLFQVELEHYEKIEGRSLSLVGKANRLAAMIRGNLGAAMQGLVVVPLLAGYDLDSSTGRIFAYDPAGGPSEERGFYSIGSGSVFARGALKKLYTEDMPTGEAVLCCLQALYDAADDDSGTGGPDMSRRIFPVVTTITGEGFRRLPEAQVADLAAGIVASRMELPDGPVAPLRN